MFIPIDLRLAFALGLAGPAAPADPDPANPAAPVISATAPDQGTPAPTPPEDPAPNPASAPDHAAAPGPAPAPAAPPPSPPTAAPAASARAADRDAQNLDRDAFLPNLWPVQPLCNLGARVPDVCLTLDAEVFAGYRLRRIAGDRFSEFALDRSELGTALWLRPHRRLDAGAVVRLEAIRSAGPQSLIGIDGDSLIVRLAQAYGQGVVHLGPLSIGVRAGQLPERWIEQLEKGYDTRGVDPLSSDRLVLFDRADLGASLTVSGWRGLVEVDLAVTNGEGRAQEELNRGKNTTALLTLRPWRKNHVKGPIALALHGLYRDGSYGIGSARAHRGAAALTFASPWAFAGVEFVQALGVREQGARVTRSVGGWVSAYAYQPYAGLFAKYDRVRQDLALAGSDSQVATAGVFSDLFGYAWRRRRRVRLYAAYQYEAYGPAAGPLPGAPAAADTHRLLLQLEAQGLVRAL